MNLSLPYRYYTEKTCSDVLKISHIKINATPTPPIYYGSAVVKYFQVLSFISMNDLIFLIDLWRRLAPEISKANQNRKFKKYFSKTQKKIFREFSRNIYKNSRESRIQKSREFSKFLAREISREKPYLHGHRYS